LNRIFQYPREQYLKTILLLTRRTRLYNTEAVEIMLAIFLTPDLYHSNEFAPYPNISDLVNFLDILLAFDPDLVGVIGGGSVMDKAKLLCDFDGLTSNAAIENAIRTSAHTSRIRRLVLAPTTAGSGSEATHFAVVYIDDDKFSVA